MQCNRLATNAGESAEVEKVAEKAADSILDLARPWLQNLGFSGAMGLATAAAVKVTWWEDVKHSGSEGECKGWCRTHGWLLRGVGYCWAPWSTCSSISTSSQANTNMRTPLIFSQEQKKWTKALNVPAGLVALRCLCLSECWRRAMRSPSQDASYSV